MAAIFREATNRKRINYHPKQKIIFNSILINMHQEILIKEQKAITANI